MDWQIQIEIVKDICFLIENEEGYQERLAGYFPVLTETIEYILNCAHSPEISFVVNERFVIQVLKDILYGMEHQDSVFLLDVLRHGLLDLYEYGKDSLQSGGAE